VQPSLLTSAEPGTGAPEARHRPGWRHGSRTADPWDRQLLLIAVLGLGVAIAGTSLAESVPVGGDWIGRAVLWAGLGVPVLIALARSRPRRLLQLRPQDLLYGATVGLLLRLAQGGVSAASGESTGFPSIPLVDGSVAPDTWLLVVVSPIVIAPLIEEFFFRGVVLVSVVVVLRRRFSRRRSLFAAAVVSTALFVIAHVLTTTTTWEEVVALTLLGGACAALVATTGRLWAAVLAHSVYNALFAALALVGTFV
jgi:membrane protease YdiL (CAAX protease family)